MGSGTKTITIIKDGINASRLPTDYRVEQQTISLQQLFAVTMKKGGGFLMKIN
jgi:hypothetical protein